ncbi:MAG: transposase [Spirochaetota bacterium]
MCNTLQQDGRPGAVLSIETAGEYQDGNPHIHAVTTDGIYTPTGSFYFMPRYGELAEKYLRSLWEMAVTKYVLEKGFVTEETIEKVSAYRHNGFSVYARRRVEYKKSDERSVAEFEQLARYIVKPHFSLESMEYVPQTGKVLYHGTMNKGKRRNFEIFEANDFLAAVTSHIPKYRQRYLNYYGEYSSRARAKEKEYQEMPREGASVEQREYRKRWAMLIRKVYEVDPLKCPKCGKEMHIVEYVREAYAFLYKQWLVSIDAWYVEPPRAPPEQPVLELTYCAISEDAHYVDEFADA